MSIKPKAPFQGAFSSRIIEAAAVLFTFSLRLIVLNFPVMAQSTPGIPVNTTGLAFLPVTPCRVADTRNATGNFGGPILAAGSVRSFAILASACGIPSTAQAYSLNVTVVPKQGLSFLTIWPVGQTQPLVSTINSDGRTKANAAIVAAGTGGAVNVYVSDATHVILDINGYFAPVLTAGANDYFTIGAPCRVADTRRAAGALSGPFLAAGQTRTFSIQSSSCSIPAGAAAYALNMTAVPHSWLGYLTAWATGTTQPTTSTLNSSTGSATANAAIVQADSNGNINVYASNDTDLVIDIQGYFAQSGNSTPLTFYAVTPCRMLDTRVTLNPLVAGVNDPTVNACGITALQPAYVVNTTVVPTTWLGYLTLYSDGTGTPSSSTLNASDGAITSNMAIVDGTAAFNILAPFAVYASNPTQLIMDVTGYFAP